jgi:hypothetical protein
MVVGFTTTYAISASHHRCEFKCHSGEVYSIQHYVIKSVGDLQQVGGFLRVLLFPPSIQIGRHDTTEILLKEELEVTNGVTN